VGEGRQLLQKGYNPRTFFRILNAAGCIEHVKYANFDLLLNDHLNRASLTCLRPGREMLDEKTTGPT